LRRVKKLAESALSAISAELDGLYARTGRPSIPPERLLKGEKRSNATHQSTTDPDAKLMRKGNGQPAKLSYCGHALMENRSGLCVDLLITDATLAEHQAARQLLTRVRRRKIHPKTLGADKGHHVKDFVQHLREHGIKPHIARIDGRKTPGLDGRTSSTEGYIRE
jgi:IS5 family transposase